MNGPPNIFTIKAVSTPIKTSIRRETKSRGWEEVTLRETAQNIADGSGLELVYDMDGDIDIDRADQLEQTDLEFLAGLCDNYGACLKVTNDRIVIYDESMYERKPAIARLSYSDVRSNINPGGRILKYSFSQDTSGCASTSSVSYKDPESGKLADYEFEIPDAPATGQSLRDNTRPGNLSGDGYRKALGVDEAQMSLRSVRAMAGDTGGASGTIDDFSDIRADVLPEAERQAKTNARKQNKSEWTCSVTMVGNTQMLAALTIDIEGFGVYDGKYFIDEATHKLGGGYETTIKGHRVLKGY